ncbi:hypothetical protein D1B17_08760 [Companilactobacillus zhachilii]|uniref:Uncharacterized protein n=1 Tax=Companilactobacillus zhachilii TaxID=2304606 RepID=A0A386PUS9_9LACO|nr:hypothetical protein [Companilactobacillus zhachilii]AYE38715.1 hypothetical protein D1B17_08760 [Companilactobacillus zhachilii]
MAKNKDLKVDLNVDTRDLEIELLKMQNSVLKTQLDTQKFINSQNVTNWSQRTVKQSREEFLNRVATAFKETYGYPIESMQLSVRTERGTDINTEKTFFVEINTRETEQWQHYTN